MLLLAACHRGPGKDNGNILARVHDKYLYESELMGVIPANTAVRDSILMAQNFMNNWIQQELLLHKAEKNLSPQQKDFSRQLADYRKSLIIYAFERALISQQLDTLVKPQEIHTYFNQHLDDFQLKENIVKASFVVLDIDSPYVKQFKPLLMDTATVRTELEELCKAKARDYFLEHDIWVRFNDLIRQVPITTYNQEAYLRHNRYIEVQDSLYRYLVHFNDFKIKESTSPISMESERIRGIIINQRKRKLIETMQKELLQKAVEENNYEIY